MPKATNPSRKQPKQVSLAPAIHDVSLELEKCKEKLHEWLSEPNTNLLKKSFVRAWQKEVDSRSEAIKLLRVAQKKRNKKGK